MKFQVWRNHDCTEWSVKSASEVSDGEFDVFGNAMILQHEIEVEAKVDGPVGGLDEFILEVGRKAGEAYHLGYTAGICDIANAACSIHAGMRHGGEAEELRMGVEEILHGADYDSRMTDLKKELQRLLEETDARDSLAHTEVEVRSGELDMLRRLRSVTRRRR